MFTSCVHSDLGGTGGMENSDASVLTSTGRGSGEMEERMGTSSDSTLAHEQSEYVTAFEGGMLINSSSTSAERRRAYRMWLEQVQRQCGSEEEFSTAISKPTWTQMAPLPSCSATSLSSEGSCSCLSPAEKRKIQVENEQFFQERIKCQPTCALGYPWIHQSYLELGFNRVGFFIDFGDRLEVGKKIAQGGQAEIYEAHFFGQDGLKIGFPSPNLVLKVFSLENSEWFRLAWAKKSKSIYMQYKALPVDIKCCFVHNCTLLKDGRFAFVMRRYWGDLRKAINVQLLKDKTRLKPPFLLSISTYIMYQIALGMRTLHRKGILHRDLKAENVLVLKSFEKYPISKSFRARLIYCHVADFESNVGVMGTRFWRPPEVLNILRSSSEEKYTDPRIWTKEVDVYAYGMTCYEVLSGCIPFQNRAANDYHIGDERPPLPDYVDNEIQELVRECWDSEPSKRPTFEIICDKLKTFGNSKIMSCKALAKDDMDAEAYRWIRDDYQYSEARLR